MRLGWIAPLMMLCALGFAGYAPADQGYTLITPAELEPMLGQVTVIDVRSSGHWDESSHKIPGAQRREAANAASWVGEYAGTEKIVLYCA